MVGKPLLYPVVANEPILKRDLGVEGSGIGISGKIPTGMRATAVRSNEIVGVAGFLYPGSRVDVMVTYTPPGGGGSGPVTQTVLQNVEVLTAGQTIEPDPAGQAPDGQRGDPAGESRRTRKSCNWPARRASFSLCCEAALIRKMLIFVPRRLGPIGVGQDLPRLRLPQARKRPGE